MWISLQFANILLLVDAKTLRVRQMIQVPTVMRLDDGTGVRIGGPHCLRECDVTGDIWVALKGSVSCHPQAGPAISAEIIAEMVGLVPPACCVAARAPPAVSQRATRGAGRPGHGRRVEAKRDGAADGGDAPRVLQPGHAQGVYGDAREQGVRHTAARRVRGVAARPGEVRPGRRGWMPWRRAVPVPALAADAVHRPARPLLGTAGASFRHAPARAQKPPPRM